MNALLSTSETYVNHAMNFVANQAKDFDHYIQKNEKQIKKVAEISIIALALLIFSKAAFAVTVAGACVFIAKTLCPKEVESIAKSISNACKVVPPEFQALAVIATGFCAPTVLAICGGAVIGSKIESLVSSKLA